MTPQKNTIFCGGNLEVVSSWPSNFISAICTDPPYGLEFMGKDWDRGLPGVRFWREFLRITKPGGFLLCFGGTRTYHRLACAIEDAGWEIRDCMMWLYGSGFPKSHNISKAIDKAVGAENIIGTKPDRWTGKGTTLNFATDRPQSKCKITAPATDLAQLWDGYGTALKPAWEPIIVAMKPLDGTFAHNAEVHGVAGLNIDAARIGTDEKMSYSSSKQKGVTKFGTGTTEQNLQGRWPANLILDEETGVMLDKQTGITKPKKGREGKRGGCGFGFFDDEKSKNENGVWPADLGGGASRFFYCAKTSRKERNMGLGNQSGKKVNDGRETPIDNPYQRGETIRKNTHPTVKPLALMKYLCTLLKMPSADQIILDPFLGSGTTGIACKELGIDFIGIEKEPEYCEIAIKRIAAVEGREITLYTEIPPIKKPVAEAAPNLAESRQRIIDAAVAALREKRK